MEKTFFSKVKSNLIILILLIGFGFYLNAESVNFSSIQINNQSSLSDLLTFAALNNPGLQAAFNRWKAVRERVTQAKSLPDPKITFAYFIREVETRVGPQRSKIGIMQMFPWFGKLKLKGEAFLKAADFEKQKFEQTRLDLLYRVKNVYYEYYFILQNINILKENIKLLEYLERVVNSKYRAGSTPFVDLIKIQIEKDKLLDQLRSANEGVVSVESKLNAILNRKSAEPLPVPEIQSVPQPTFSKNQLIEWLLANNPELKSIDFMTDKAEIGIKLAKKNYFPDFSLGLDYIITDEARMTGIEESGKDPIVAMAQINIPLWFSKNKAGVKQAKARLEASLDQKAEKQNNLLARLEMVFYRYQDARKKVELYHDTLIPQARQAIEVLQSAYKTGKNDILNLIDSQRTLLSLEINYEQSLVSCMQRLSELEMLVGKKLF